MKHQLRGIIDADLLCLAKHIATKRDRDSASHEQLVLSSPRIAPSRLALGEKLHESSEVVCTYMATLAGMGSWTSCAAAPFHQYTSLYAFVQYILYVHVTRVFQIINAIGKKAVSMLGSLDASGGVGTVLSIETHQGMTAKRHWVTGAD